MLGSSPGRVPSVNESANVFGVRSCTINAVLTLYTCSVMQGACCPYNLKKRDMKVPGRELFKQSTFFGVSNPYNNISKGPRRIQKEDDGERAQHDTSVIDDDPATREER